MTSHSHTPSKLNPKQTAGQVAVMLSALVAIFLFASIPAYGATSCFSESCATICTPDAPVGISTIISAGDFPSGATTPIVFIDPEDGRGKRLVATQQGAILVWDGASEAFLPTMFLDLRDNTGGPVQDGGERGLLAMAVDPEYRDNGLFYVFYTRRNSGGGTDGDIVIERYQRSAGNPDVADAGSALPIMVIDHPAGNHNGGWLAFGPDGFLYISTGDGGGGCDSNAGTNGDGQRTDTLAGKILRIDTRGVDPNSTAPDDCGVGAANYAIPSDNPFAGTEPACDEVWVYGLRNPFRFSFDRLTGDLYIGDVGQNKWEEINMKAASTPAPVNFGWVCREGCETAGNNESGCSTGGCPMDTGTTCEFPRAAGDYYDPILCHYNGGWKAVMGGYVYRGTEVPSIVGDYLYSDSACGRIWKTSTLDPSNPAAITASCWASGFGGSYGFAEDGRGELYAVVGGAGRIDCIHNGDGCPWASGVIFADGFESGSTSEWTSDVP